MDGLLWTAPHGVELQPKLQPGRGFRDMPSYALRGCHDALLAGSKLAPASCSQVNAGGCHWLLLAVRGHAPVVRRLVPPPATFAPLDNFCREAEQCAERRLRRARRSTVCPGYSARWSVLPSMKRSRSLHLPSPGHTSGSVSTYPGRCEVIQSLVAVVGMVVRSGMSNTSLRSMCSALGMT